MSKSEFVCPKALLAHLANQRDSGATQLINPGQFHYLGIPDFLLREGQFFEPRPLPAGVDVLEIRHCYQNAFWTALQERLVYVEGYAVSSELDLPLLHAWNLDGDGFVVDRTWSPHGRLYFGVIFPLAAVPRKRGTQFPIIDDWEHGYPILRKAWNREAARREAFKELSI